MEDITETFKAVQAKGISQEKLAKVNKEKSINFKATLALLIAFFLWITWVEKGYL